jgi:hypothetical protein
MFPSCGVMASWPLLLGFGKLGTPCERMHWENANEPLLAELLGVAPAAEGVPLEQAVASIAAAASAVTENPARPRRLSLRAPGLMLSEETLIWLPLICPVSIGRFLRVVIRRRW